MNQVVHLVLDDTAMVAAGRGNLLASRLIHRAHAEAGWHLYASTCALVEAARACRPSKMTTTLQPEHPRMLNTGDNRSQEAPTMLQPRDQEPPRPVRP
ncbi:hypothetical protein SAMN05216252_12655 [Actinacidiphila glaucinigra]|uniref:Uncharacterized protein n=1 Tax=Actinacidiphila glaucinigra TaxID=235986 RepID=A0A239MQ28_9ACTN|nr:hypothetical protein SAMN05216252_12655 [Actinacidiphila glaucinigra]